METQAMIAYQAGYRDAQARAQVLVSALEEIVSYCPTPNDPTACKIAECNLARVALQVWKELQLQPVLI